MAPMLVMGLFGFLGKAVKGIGKAVGGAVKLGVGVAKFGLTSGLLPIPGGGLAGRIAGTLLQAKRPMSTTAQKFPLPINVMRGKSGPTLSRAAGAILTRMSTPRVQSASPVLPGGAIATRSGPVPQQAIPPLTYSGGGGGTSKRRRKSSSRKRTSRKRGRGRRKLKFGSPAWRKKYLGHGRKRRRRRAA